MPDTTIRYYTTHVKDLVQRYESADVSDLHALLADSFPPGARLFFSVPLHRDDVATDEFDAKGRRFTTLSHAEWTGLCCRAGFNILSSTPTSDGLGRKTFDWLNCLAVTDRKKQLLYDERTAP